MSSTVPDAPPPERSKLKRLPVSDRADELRERLRQIPLADRLAQIPDRISKMCSQGRPPRMSIPVQWDDDDWFITHTAQDAIADIAARSEPKPTYVDPCPSCGHSQGINNASYCLRCGRSLPVAARSQVDAAEICAEMARESIKGVMDERSTDEQIIIYNAQADVLRIAEKRIRASTPADEVERRARLIKEYADECVGSDVIIDVQHIQHLMAS